MTFNQHFINRNIGDLHLDAERVARVQGDERDCQHRARGHSSVAVVRDHGNSL